MRAFSPKMFPTTVYFYPGGNAVDQHGTVTVGDMPAGTVAVKCRVEPEVSVATRAETHHSPEGKKVWSVYTPTEPAVGIDWVCDWHGDLMVVKADPGEQSTGYGVLWRTECERVS